LAITKLRPSILDQEHAHTVLDGVGQPSCCLHPYHPRCVRRIARTSSTDLLPAPPSLLRVFTVVHHCNQNLKVSTADPLAAVEPGLRAEGKTQALPMVLCFNLVEPQRCHCATVDACVPIIELSLTPAGAAADNPRARRA
jgi:hypothetical protein